MKYIIETEEILTTSDVKKDTSYMGEIIMSAAGDDTINCEFAGIAATNIKIEEAENMHQVLGKLIEEIKAKRPSPKAPKD